MIRFFIFATALFSAVPILVQSAEGDHPIVGVWEWTRKESKCTETYTYRKDGTALVESGQEKSEDKYEITDTFEENNRYRMKVTTVKDNGGKDCAGNGKDNTGQTATVFVEFNDGYKEMIICLDANSFKCFGPLTRMSR
ncbi:MAG: hypothetical protein ACREV9_13665 [Burkholderiales bacterium]